MVRRTPFAEWIDEELALRDMSKQELIRRTGLGQGSVYDSYHGKRAPSLYVVTSIAQALDVPVRVALERCELIDPEPDLDPSIRRLIQVATPLPEDERQRLIALGQALRAWRRTYSFSSSVGPESMSQ